MKRDTRSMYERHVSKTAKALARSAFTAQALENFDDQDADETMHMIETRETITRYEIAH